MATINIPDENRTIEETTAISERSHVARRSSEKRVKRWKNILDYFIFILV